MRADKAFLRYMKRVGVYQRVPRIHNVDLGTHTLGYTEVNSTAQSPFNRTVVHKGWFAGDSDITPGTRILDRGDNRRYLVMDAKAEIHRGTRAFYDATLYYAARLLTITRLGAAAVNAFGRPAPAQEQVVADGVWAAVNPQSVDIIEQPDGLHPRDKIELVVQRGIDVRAGDRIRTDDGELFKVTSVHTTKLEALWVLIVERDQR